MAGFFSGHSLEHNAIETARARRSARGLPLIDLTSSNPTHQGLFFPPAILEQGCGRYIQSRRYDPDPRGLPCARAAVAGYYRRRSPPLVLEPEQIIITAGTSEAYSLLFSLLSEPGDTFLAPDVSYPLFDMLAAHQRVVLKPYHLEERQRWHLDESSLLAAADERSRAVIMISPHNPTGMVVQHPIAALDTLGLPLICDEVFADWPVAADAVPPLAALHSTIPVFLLNGISKMFALPDLKLGWIVMNACACERYGARLELLNDAFLSASTLTQSLLPLLFERGDAFRAVLQQHVQENVQWAHRRAAGSGVLELALPEGGYMLFPKIASDLDEEQVVLELIDAGVLVQPGYFFGELAGPHLAFSGLVRREDLEVGLHLVIESLKRARPR